MIATYTRACRQSGRRFLHQVKERTGFGKARRSVFQQLSLLDESDGPKRQQTLRALDDESAQLLEQFSGARREHGASPESVRREVSVLRTLARQASVTKRGASLPPLLNEPRRAAELFVEPPDSVAQSTVRARYVAFRRLVEIVGPLLGRDPLSDLNLLDSRLPRKRSSGWHTTGTRVGGEPGRRRDQGPVL